tara:strand:- start:22044 stop:22931 length:888 start_codon:yes stop_codon:yes gene_type:complete
MKKKIMIIGNGQLGKTLFQILKKTKFKIKLYTKKKVDFLIPSQIKNEIKDLKPDYVINCSALTNVPLCEIEKKKAKKINSLALYYLGKLSKSLNFKLIHFSTDYVFNGKKKNSYKEADKVNPINFYGYSKMLGEKELKKIGCSYFIFRISWVYNNFGNNFFLKIIKKILDKKISKINVVKDQIGIPTSTKFVAKAINYLLERGFFNNPSNFGIYHLVPHGQTTWFNFAQMIEKFILKKKKIKSKSKIKPILTAEFMSNIKRPLNGVLNNSKFIKKTNYKIYNWKKYLIEEMESTI